MRYPAEWMCPLDERILEILDNEGLGTAEHIEDEVKLWTSVGRVRERCRVLADSELIEPVTDDCELWELTEKGREYLDGDLDARNLPTPSKGRV
jgi:hypothetical protein